MTKISLTTLISEDEFSALKKSAQKNKRSVSGEARYAITLYLEPPVPVETPFYGFKTPIAPRVHEEDGA
jgi:hypothetical protein